MLPKPRSYHKSGHRPGMSFPRAFRRTMALQLNFRLSTSRVVRQYISFVPGHSSCDTLFQQQTVVVHSLKHIRLFATPLAVAHQASLSFWQPTPVLLPGKSHGLRSLVGCSPLGLEESDTTEQLHFHFSLSCIGEGNGNPLQCSCLENPRDGGAWWAAIYGVTQSQTQLKRLSSSSRACLTLVH